MIRIEICTSNYKSVCNAQDGGADCAELCSALEVGGITPSYGVLAEVAHVMRIPVRVLIRPRSGNYIYDDREVEMMCRDIEKVAMLGYEGVVIGALNDEGDIDVKAVKSMMRAGKGMKFTFHRAVDASRDIFESFRQLAELGFDKVLTSGGCPDAPRGASVIAELQKRYGDRVKIMPGGGINISNVESLLRATGVSDCHASLTENVTCFYKSLYPDGVDATGASMVWKESDLNKIKMFVQLCRKL